MPSLGLAFSITLLGKLPLHFEELHLRREREKNNTNALVHRFTIHLGSVDRSRLGLPVSSISLRSPSRTAKQCCGAW